MWMSQKFPVNNFPWVKYTSKFNYVFIKSYNEESNEGYFIKVDVQYLGKFHGFIMYFHFYQKERKLKKSKNL